VTEGVVPSALASADLVSQVKDVQLATMTLVYAPDVNMPNMDGLTIVEKIHGELANKTVNVIMQTTESRPAMKERGKAAGVKGWIVKPFKGDAVLETCRKLAG
jgi:two-component system, chemotaxis family, chemotaxis protein CheY